MGFHSHGGPPVILHFRWGFPQLLGDPHDELEAMLTGELPGDGCLVHAVSAMGKMGGSSETMGISWEVWYLRCCFTKFVGFHSFLISHFFFGTKICEPVHYRFGCLLLKRWNIYHSLNQQRPFQ